MAREIKKPRVGEGVWVQGKPQPNGKIVNVDYHGSEVHVKFYDTDEVDAFDIRQFQCFNERLNQWKLEG